MKKGYLSLLLLVVLTVGSCWTGVAPHSAYAADERIKYTERAVGANHPTYSDTLNRLTLVEHNNDGTHDTINATDILTKGPYADIRAYLPSGYVTDGSVDYTTEIQAAIDAAEADNKVVFFPEGTWQITDRLLVDTAGVKIIGIGKGSIVRQDTWGKPAFEVKADDIWVDGFYLLSTQTKTAISATPFYEGTSARGYSSGVYVANSDRYKLTNLYVSGFVAGLKLRGEVSDSSLSEDGIVENLQGHTLDQGIVFMQQRGLRIDGVDVQDTALTQTGDPVHTIYSVGTPIGSEVHSEDVIINNIYSRDSTDQGHMIQLKYAKGFTGTNWNARNVKGLYLSENTIDSNFSVLNGFEMGDVTSDSVGIIHISGTSDRRNRLSKIQLSSSVTSNVYLNMLNASGTNDDNIIEDVYINDSSGGPAAVGALRGTRNVFRNIDIYCASTARQGFTVSKDADDTSTDCRIENISGENTAGGKFIDIRSGATGTKIIIDSSKIERASGGILIDDGGTDSIVNDSIKEIITLNNSDATPSVNAGNNFETGTVTDTITAWDAGYKGQIIVVKSKAAITYDLTTANDATHNLDGSSADIVTSTGDITMWQYDSTSWTLMGFVDISADNSGGA